MEVDDPVPKRFEFPDGAVGRSIINHDHLVRRPVSANADAIADGSVSAA